MICPIVSARIENAYGDFTFIILESSHIAAFVLIAVWAGVSKIFQYSRAAMFDAPNVVNVKNRRQKTLWHKTIFTYIPRTFGYFLAKCIGNGAVHVRCK